MSDIDSGAPAPAEPAGVPIEANSATPAPLGSQTPVAEKPPEAPTPDAKPDKPEAEIKDDKPSKTAGEAVRKAMDKINKDAEAKAAEKPAEAKADAKDDAKPEPKPADAKPEQPRENGKFASAAPKADQAPEETPTWLKPHEKEVWQKAPPEVRAIVERRNTEAAAGLEKYRASHEAQERLRPFNEMAQQAGTTVEAALKSYTDLDKLLHTDKVKGIEAVLHRVGITPHEYASHILNQSPDEQRSQSESTIRELKQQVEALTQQMGGVTQTLEQKRQAEEQARTQETTNQIEKWSADKPYFELIAPHIADAIRDGAKDLDSALSAVLQKYPQLSVLTKPATAIPDTASPAAIPDEPQKLAGQKSISGAPTTGSDPAYRKPASSNREALQRAFARIPT